MNDFKQKVIEATAYIRKLNNYREKVKVSENWDKELGPIAVDEAHRVGLDLPIALGLLETETGPFENKNIFGGDIKSPFFNEEVNEKAMQRALRDDTPIAVGPTQLADYELINEAAQLGGAHIPRYTMRVGFRALKKLVEKYGVSKAFIYYNGGEQSTNAYSVNVYAPQAFANYEYYKEQINKIGD